ncbi:sickle tail protein homolog isoform X4 [Callorhinchus milii]|uniref:sickle tail protein homolog isoform X4 n=1 Tax=Callorhinchus milii TaxID=7868 RepID=UPI001C3F840D|nr:sickle tail protein homolog isoform X4 [Callorhinchus milii]
MSGNRVQFAGLPPLGDGKDGHKVANQGKSNLRVTSSEDADRIKAKENLANGNNRTANTKVARNIPRRHTVGGARSSKEALGMQPSEMERKREAFLEHLKQKYPHHATAIMGQQERLKEQSRSPKHLRSPQAALTDQSEHLSVASADSFEAMADSEIPNNFNRGTRFRTSLPVVRSTNQTKDRSLGVLYLQYGDEIKKIAMPNEITTMDTVHALFVGAFHQQLTMKVLESQNVAVYIKDEARNVYYELSDLRSIQDRALLKVYHKDPAHISFSHSSRAVNGDLRMQREVMYATKDAPHSFRHQVPGPGPFIHGPPNSPPLAHSMPPSPSRIPYNGGRAIAMPGSATVPRDILSSVPPSRSISPSHPGAILERRDVKPDEDLSNKNLALFRNEGLYADPYMFHDGRMSIASPHSGIPGDIPDHVAFHRPSVRPGNMYPNSPVQSDMMEQSMYRMKSRKYTDTYIPTVGSKTPPPSPQKMIDVRMMELHGANSHMAHTIQPDRSSPVRLMRKDSGPPALLETIIPKSRSNAPSPSISDVVPFSAEKLMSGFVASSAANDPETRARMIAMEKQIASLTGLVQSALFKGGNGNGTKEIPSEKLKVGSHPSSSEAGGTTNATAAKYSEINLESLSDVIQISTTCTHQLQVFELRRNVQDLRQQLQQLRFLQLQNQEMLKGMLKKAESEINSRVSEALKRMEDPLQRQRMLVEEERQKYLTEEEKIIQQLCGLEISIEELKKDCTSAQQKVTLKDVEEGAVALRHVGESLAGLKAEFPPLQNKMRAVLRVEVEAVKFLKEEPHKLESLLKRVKSMTDLLTGLRRLVTEGLGRGTESTQSLDPPPTCVESEISKEAPFQTVEQVTAHHASLPQAAPAAFHETQNSLVKSEPQMVIHHIQSSSVLIQPTHHSSMLVHPSQSPPGIPKQAHNVSATVQPQAPSSSAVTKQCQESIERVAQTQSPQAHQPLSSPSTAQPASAQNLFIDEIHAASAKKSIYRKMSFEAAEREWEEKRHNINQYDGREFERLLEEAQANLMKAIPSLEVEPEQKTIQKPDEADGIKQLEEMPLPEKGTEKPMKSPPPPPPRRSYPPGSGLTTARSGEVVVTAKKDIITIIADEENSPVQPPKSPKSPLEMKGKLQPPAPIAASAIKEDEDEGDRIMAELQAFQKCSVMDVSSKPGVEQPRVELQTRDLRPMALISPKEKKQKSDIFSEDKQAIDTPNEGQAELESAEDLSDKLETSTFIFHDVHSNDSQIEVQPQNDTSVPQEASKETLKCLGDEEQSVSDQTQVALESAAIEHSVTLEKELVPALRGHESIVKVETEYRLHKPDRVSELDNTYSANTPDMNEVVNRGDTNLVRPEKGQPYMQQITSFVSQQDSNVNQFHPQEWDVPTAESSQQAGNCSQQVVLRPKTSKKVTVRYAEDIDSSGSSGDETSSTDNIAFMITNTKVQALSSGEVNDLVNQSGEGIQTVSVDANQAMTAHQYTPQDTGNEAPEFCIDKKPVIIIFDEPMDIRSAYKRLSTIFESDEELEKMMAEERIEEENEDMEVASETVTSYSTRINNMNNNQLCPESFALNSTADSESGEPSDVRFGLDETKTANKASTKAVQDETSTPDCVDTSKNDSKKKFKFKFPKKQLAALTQAIRTGTKTGRKTLQVVVYEDEEEPDGTVKQHKESKRFEITRSKNKEEAASKTSEPKQHSTIDPVSNSTRTDQIRKNTYKTLDSLEQTIKQLETTISEMSPKVSDQGEEYVDNATIFYDSGTVQDESKSPADQSLLSSGKAPQQAKGKPPLLPKISTKASNLMSPTSRMPVSVGSKTQQQRQQQQSNADKATKPKLQDPQRQFRQANGSAKKAGGESKATSPTLPASKIPALSPSSGKTSSISGPSSDTNSPSTSSKYALPATNFTPAAGRSTPLSPVSHIPSASNGSLKLHAQNPPLTGKSQHPSFPLHVPNGRSSSSSSSPSPVSPTSLIQGVKSIRTIHTASFASYKQQNSSQSKPSVATLKETA